ncbi:acyl carrier protein [Streptomyces sp. NPDC053493]|uniref:acyl carrier protein n=1 Tax=Streptomyces sp. NPDC053493 TaxID=3365705 RepID=UPI0037D18367
MSNNSVALSSEEIEARIRIIVAEELELEDEPAELDASAQFVEDFDADSLALIQILARIEKELGIAVPVDQSENLTDLSALSGHVISLASEAERA